MGPKKKKTKKELEEERRLAEEERKRLEEEAEKQRLLEEERRRVEEEKRRIEEEKRRQEELKRLGEEQPIYNERSSIMIDNRKTSERSKIKDLDPKYMNCDPLPDPNKEKDLTTYITLLKEQKDKTL
jgi:hypothetical protein